MRPGRAGPTAREGEKISEEGRIRKPLLGGGTILFLLALVKLLVHLSTAGNYGYFRDELYYIAASGRLDLGYVDFPPFVALATALARATLGDSLLALDLLPALAGAAVVVLAGLMARELGGGRFAQGIAALAVLVAPNFLVFGTFISMDAFDQLFWVSATYVLLLILKRNEPRLWLLFGLIAGLGLLTKLTMLSFGLAVLVALLITPARRHLLSPWPWIGGVIAVAFLAPYLYWNAMNGWPTPEFWGQYGAKVDEASPVEFLIEQIVTMQPPTLPLWLAGLCYYLFAREARSYRALGWIYVILFVLFATLGSKFYFLAPSYPALFAAGGVVIERFFRARGRWRWSLPAYAAVLAISGADHCRAGAPRRDASEDHGLPRRRRRDTGGDAGGGRATANPGRQVRLGGYDGDRRPRIRPAPARKALRGLRAHRQLRRGRGHRLFRREARAAEGYQRPQQLLSVGTEGL
jgi:4-amino-4-deoxy-L-arabinose transferase-like glycosyltransferase